MYKLLVCDDEKWIRQGLRMRITHMELPFSDVYEAQDGKEAAEIIDTYQPEVVVTDIRMDKTNGLELIEQAMTRYPEMQFIIVSGYGEFSYAEKAIRLGVCSYLLKPVDEEELYNALKLAISRIENCRMTNKSRNAEKMLGEDNRKIRLENAVNGIFLSSGQHHPDLQEQLCKLWNIPDAWYQCMAVRIEGSSFEASGFEYQDMELLKYGICNVVEELAEMEQIQLQVCRDLHDLNKVLLLIANTDRVELERQTSRMAVRVMYSITKKLRLTITVSVSGLHESIVREMYGETKMAEHYKFIKGVNRIYYYNGNLGDAQNISLPESQLELLRRYLQERNMTGIREVVHKLLAIPTDKAWAGNYLFCLYLNIINMVLNIYPDTLWLLGKPDKNYMDIQCLEHFETNAQIESYLCGILAEVCQYKSGQERSVTMNCKTLMKQVKEYLDRNYMREITLGNVASLFNMNATYFSTLFKQEIGKPFTQYLRDVRMKKACELLRDSNVNTEFIATSVGYQDMLYFYRVFKRTIGMTPTEYRRRCRESNNK